jgi:glycosyltransferase involved in cell wall biosynthesis
MKSDVPVTSMKLPPDDVLKVLMIGALPVELNMVKGGVEAVIMNLFAGFRNIPGIRIIHVAFTKEIKAPLEIHFADNVVIHFLPFAIPFELMDYFINDKALQNIIAKEDPHLIHIQEITPHIIRFLRYPKNNIVVTQHGIMKEELKYASGVGQKLKCLFKAGVERYIFPVFDNVIFISRYNQKLYPPKPVNAVQIYNPVNPIFFADAPSPVLKANSMVYVGVLSRRKNIRIIIEGMREMNRQNRRFTLHVAGGFKEAAYETEIMSLVRDSGLADQIIFHGWLRQEEVREIFKQCPVFILPSLQETLPVSIGEAMAQGKVVVATDVGAISEMFTNKVSGFIFHKNDLTDLVRVLNTIYDNPDLAAIGERARKEAVEKFHPALIASRTIAFYQEVLQRKKDKAV